VSQSLPNQVNDFNVKTALGDFPGSGSRNPFQTRSTTSITVTHSITYRNSIGVAIPSKPGQRLQSFFMLNLEVIDGVSQSLPNQVNDFNTLL